MFKFSDRLRAQPRERSGLRLHPYLPNISGIYSRKERLTHRQERNPLVVLIARNACGLRVEDRFVVHEELISVVAMRELHLDEPTAVHATAHGVGTGIPPIEITHQINRSCGRGGTIEIDRLRSFSCRIQIGGSFIEHGIYNGKVVEILRVTPTRKLVAGRLPQWFPDVSESGCLLFYVRSLLKLVAWKIAATRLAGHKPI